MVHNLKKIFVSGFPLPTKNDAKTRNSDYFKFKNLLYNWGQNNEKTTKGLGSKHEMLECFADITSHSEETYIFMIFATIFFILEEFLLQIRLKNACLVTEFHSF